MMLFLLTPQVYRHPVTLILDCVTSGNSLTQMFLTGHDTQAQPHRQTQVLQRITPADQVNNYFMSKKAVVM